MDQGMHSAQAKKIAELRAMDLNTLTQEQKMILSIAYDEASRDPRSDTRRTRSSRRGRRSPPRNNRGEDPPSWERRHRR